MKYIFHNENYNSLKNKKKTYQNKYFSTYYIHKVDKKNNSKNRIKLHLAVEVRKQELDSGADMR